jgi:hypothetical protein
VSAISQIITTIITTIIKGCVKTHANRVIVDAWIAGGAATTVAMPDFVDHCEVAEKEFQVTATREQR